MRPSSLVQALLLAAASSAWASERDSLGVAERGFLPVREVEPLLPRQNGNPQNGNPKQAASSSQVVVSSSAAPKNPPKKGKTTAKPQPTKTFNDILPAGGVSMITPAAILGPQYYKIGNNDVTEYVTFKWNFTSLSVTPNAVDVVASCSLNAQTYAIALNQTITKGAHTQAVTWDTGEYARTGIQLPIATYTLLIYDSESSPDAVASAGYLGTYNQLAFGLYTPKPATPLSQFVCVGCNGAGSLERHTLRFLFGMVAVTVLSFGWFTGVAGLW